MKDLNEMMNILRQMLSPHRFNHSIKTMEAAIRLAEKYGGDVQKAAIAGLVHDCAKDLHKDAILPMCHKYGIIVDDITAAQPELLHGRIGACMAKELFDIECPQILSAIADHTMGRPDMDMLGKIVFIADYIEAGRDYDGADEIRKAADESLEKAIVAGIDNTIGHILSKGRYLHPQTVSTRNWALGLLKDRQGSR